MNFEELQKSWQSQQLTIPHDQPVVREALANKWLKQQRTALWSNIGTTTAFIATFFAFGKIYFSLHAGRSLYFGGTILFMTILMLVYLLVIWKGIALKRIDLSVAGNEYIARYLKILYWRKKTTTTYTWIYIVLLYAALLLYYQDALAEASLLLRIGVPVVTTLYLAAVLFFVRRKQNKQLVILDELIAELTRIKNTDLD